MKEKLKVWSKKWWFWVVAVVLFLGIIGSFMEDEKKYTIVGENLGEYGKEVVLNASTDLPTKKYLYKLPAGKYTVTTTDNKMASFYIVKDEVVKTGTAEYPEELDYVSEQYSLTAGADDFNGIAKKNVDIKLKSDESILIIGTSTLELTKTE